MQQIPATTETTPGQLPTAVFLILLGVAAVRLCWLFVGRWHRPSPWPATRLHPLQVIEVALVFLLSQLLAGALLLRGTDSQDQAEHPIDITQNVLVMLVATALTGAYAIVITKRSGGHMRDLGLHADGLAKSLAFAVLLYATFFPIVLGFGMAWQELSEKLLGHPPATQRIVDELAARPEVRSNLTFILSIALLVPFLEELLFRGFLYTALRRHLNAPAAIVIDAIVFGVIHDAGISTVMLLGGLLAFIFERTRSLYACTLAHALHNSLTVLVIFRLQGA